MDLFDVYPLYPIEPVRGEGAYVYDAEGQAYLDFYGGHAVISIGHSHPEYVRRIQEQVARLGFYSNSVQNSLQHELASKLGALSGLDDYRLFLCNSGAEANENALKIASFHNGRRKVIAFERAFHGRTSAAVMATDKESVKAPLNRGYPVEFHAWNQLDTVLASLAQGDVCAVIIEGIQGIGGIYQPDGDVLLAIQAACRQNGTLLILDEIQSGYGRSGQFFAFQHIEGLEPDIVSMAKGMGNGFPIGGILLHPRFKAKHGLLGTTFGGNHLACAAGCAVLDVLQRENALANATRLGELLKRELAHLPGLVELRGQGLMIGLEMNRPVADLRRRLLLEQHVFTGSSSDPNTIRLLPALTITEAEVRRFIRTFSQFVQNNQPETQPA